MASPKTIAAKLGAEQRAEATRKALLERLAKTYPSLPRKSSRWIGRTKGLPFSRCVLKRVIPLQHDQSSVFVLLQPTKGWVHKKRATPELLRVFFPSLPENLAAAMLGN